MVVQIQPFIVFLTAYWIVRSENYRAEFALDVL